MGTGEPRIVDRVVRRVGGHWSSGPNSEPDQSCAAIRSPHAPPPIRKAGRACRGRVRAGAASGSWPVVPQDPDGPVAPAGFAAECVGARRVGARWGASRPSRHGGPPGKPHWLQALHGREPPSWSDARSDKPYLSPRDKPRTSGVETRLTAAGSVGSAAGGGGRSDGDPWRGDRRQDEGPRDKGRPASRPQRVPGAARCKRRSGLAAGAGRACLPSASGGSRRTEVPPSRRSASPAAAAGLQVGTPISAQPPPRPGGEIGPSQLARGRAGICRDAVKPVVPSRRPEKKRVE
jgi:hypothetical protein